MGVSPSIKETTLHYWRDPLIEELALDDEIELVGVVYLGSPQANDEKMYVSERLGTLVEALNVDGVIISSDGFGNSHIDFASHIEQIGKRSIPVVGLTFGVLGFVVENHYMNAVIEVNKSEECTETEVVGENTIVRKDAMEAIVMLKEKIKNNKRTQR